MVFDSWAGELGPAAFEEFSKPYLSYISANLPKKLQEMNLERVPMTVFPKGCWHALNTVCDIGYDVVGLDWMQSPADAVKIRGDRRITFQGNADPGVLYGTHENITKAVEEMVNGFWGQKKGWIANLGHGESIHADSHCVSTEERAWLILGRHHSGCQPRGPQILLV